MLIVGTDAGGLDVFPFNRGQDFIGIIGLYSEVKCCLSTIC